MKRMSFFNFVVLCTICCMPLVAQEKEEPLLTIAAVSDVHSMNSMITPASGKLEDIKPRSSFTKTMAALKETENIDVLVIGGDNISDKTFSEANYKQYRTTLASIARGAFQDGKTPYALYVNGNHEYEVANFDKVPKNWNAGDYYSTIMKQDIGALPESECFYEMAENDSGPQLSLLTAYHYKLYGYDFVVMNTGKYFFKSAWDYQVSAESVEWVDKKLDEICKYDPSKLVFFLMHVPFHDSNSLNSGKGLKNNAASQALKKALAKHHNLVMLYGHDHGGDNAYTRSLTSQRATVYDEDGNVLPTTDERHMDGPTAAKTVDAATTPDAEGRVAKGDFTLWNAYAGKYMSVDDNNLGLAASPITSTFDINNDRVATIKMTYGGTTYGLHVGSSGRYSRGDASNILLFRVLNPSADKPTAVRAERVKAGETYLVVALYSSKYYAMAGEVYSGGSASQRLKSYQVEIDADTIKYNDASTVKRLQWTLKAVEPKPAAATSFMSLFMGSMRYYYNSFDAADPADMPHVVQALLVYVYEDSVVFSIKNYNETGVISGITIEKIPATYKMVMEPQSSKVVYTNAEGVKDSCVVRAGDDVTMNDSYKSLYVASTVEDVNATYVRMFDSSTAGKWQAWYLPFDVEYGAMSEHYDVAEIAGVMVDKSGANYIGFQKIDAGVVKANTPYVVRAKTTGEVEVAASKTTLQPTAAARRFTIQSAYKNFEFGGVYENSYLSAEQPTYALNKSGNFALMKESVVLRPFRIYMRITDREDNPYAAVTTPSEVKVVVLGEDETSIENVDADVDVDGEIYNLAGQKLQKLQKGINIVNGKKVLF